MRITLVAWLCAWASLTHAQERTPTGNGAPLVSYSALSVHEELQSGPEISIKNVTFSGFIQMPISHQEEIANSIKRQTYAHTLDVDGVVEEALERVRAGWLNDGFFKVQVNGDAKTLTTTESGIQLALFVHVDENARYRLGTITFKNNKAILNTALRDQFPIKDGAIFSCERIAEGLQNLRKFYGEFGYVNYTGVPLTRFDDETKKAYLEINVDEGKQFYVSRINVEGIGAPARQKVLKELALKPGDIYNTRLWIFPYGGSRPCSPTVIAIPTGPSNWTRARAQSLSHSTSVPALYDNPDFAHRPVRLPCLKKVRTPVRKWAATFAIAGAMWMIFVLQFGSPPLARLSNYPGTFGARWVHFRGIAPSSVLVCGFNVWLVLTSAAEWVAVGLTLRAVLRRLSKVRSSRLS